MTRLVSSPERPANWPLRIRAAVTVGIPIPGSRWKHSWVLDNIGQEGTGMPLFLCELHTAQLMRGQWETCKSYWQAGMVDNLQRKYSNMSRLYLFLLLFRNERKIQHILSAACYSLDWKKHKLIFSLHCICVLVTICKPCHFIFLSLSLWSYNWPSDSIWVYVYSI